MKLPVSGKKPFHNWCCFPFFYFNIIWSSYKKWIWICESWEESEKEGLCTAAYDTWWFEHWATLWYNA